MTPASDEPKPPQAGAPEREDKPEEIRVDVNAALAESEAPDDDARRRRVRRTRRVERDEAAEAESPPPAEGPDAPPPARAPRQPRERRGPRPGGKPPRGERAPRRAPGGVPSSRPAALGQPQKRTIYRQDAVATPPAKPASKPAAPEPSKPEAPDKLTLILHPAPKAAPPKRKKEARALTPKEALKARLARQSQGASKSQKEKSDASQSELEAAWLEAGADEAVSVLENAREAAEALVKAWLERSNVAAIARAAHSDRLVGRARKAARRALNVLRARGVEVPDAAPADEPAPERGPEPPVASFVPPDASGTSFLSISQRQPGGRFQVADVLVRNDLGVMHASSGRIAGKHIRNWKNRVEERFGAAPVEVPLDWARHRIAEARKQNERSGQLVPLGFDSCAPLFEPAPSEAPPHPLSDLEADVSETDAQKAAPDSDRLHNEPEFRSWVPDRRAVDELLSKVGERVGAEGAQDPKRVDEALRLEVSAATDRYFSPERRARLADQMRDSAISVRRRAGDEAAERVLAVARAVREAGLITSPPSEIPFLEMYFRKAVAILVQQGQGRLQVPIPRTPAETPSQETESP